jgi:hypothetical protein
MAAAQFERDQDSAIARGHCVRAGRTQRHKTNEKQCVTSGTGSRHGLPAKARLDTSALPI